MQRNTFSNEKQWISGLLDKRSTTLVELGTDGTVQNPKKRRTFAPEISDEDEKILSSGCRKPKLLTRTHCVMVRFDDEEYARFMSRYKESGVYAKAVFCKSMVFGESFRVIQANKEKEDDCRKLYSLHAWFREMATSYNLAVKELHSHFSERKTMALLNRMEGMTKEMSAIVRQVIALVKDISIQWEQAVVSG